MIKILRFDPKLSHTYPTSLALCRILHCLGSKCRCYANFCAIVSKMEVLLEGYKNCRAWGGSTKRWLS